MENIVLEVKNLTKRFKKFTAVNNISFHLEKGEILGFLGPNGAGKTTTIQMLLGTLIPTAGEINYFGKNLKDNKEEISEQINFSSTYTNLPWILTIKENLKFISYLYNIKERKQRLDKISEMFQIGKLLNKKMQSLSAGQLTRVNLAKSFINFPKVLLLDEPTASLDPDIATYVRKLLKKQREEFGVSIIITSHNMAEIENLCDRVIFINNGEIIADNTPENLAKSVGTAHVELMFGNSLEKAITLLKKDKIPYLLDGAHVTVGLKEKQIPFLLQNFMENKIQYDEISIEKPTLEDYFLSQTSKKKI
jgi:ABC-2 type transport system ATP-binding protein